MRRLRTFSMALMLMALLTAGSLNAQILSGSGGTVTTNGSSSTGVALSAVSGYPDVSVTTGNTASTSGFHVFNASGIELLRAQSNGNVGIGTTAPATLLHVSGGGVQGKFQGLNGSTYIGDGQLYTDRSALYVQFNPTNYIDFQNGRMVINSSGNVGIGATAPSGFLQIGATYPARFSDIQSIGIPNGTLLDMAGNSEIHIANIQIGRLAAPVIQTMGAAGQSALYLNQYSDNDVIVGSNSYTARGLKVQSTGLSSYAGGLSVGQNLTVTGTISAAGTIESTSGGFKFPNGTIQTTAFQPSLGIVTVNNVATPKYLLQSSNSSQQSAFSTDGAGAYIDVVGHATPANNNIIFRTTNTANSMTPVEAMRITSTGGVEIGAPVSDPTVRVNVNGNMKVTGTLTATSVVNAVYGQDVAEWVRGDRELVPGTVVVVNPEKTNEVMPSSAAYDTTVAGVVSAQPGLILGRPGDLKATVATSGRVRVRVDARKGAIRVGDLLVTSDEEGTAMKSQPIEVGGRKFHQPGTILGKALEPLPDGVGEILVLLCLG